ncbi:MAG: hypothetical protein JNM48_00805 [Rhodospirillales bacterium]|nr:hypothetical protein [Rhodospirillales bacterium]
MIRHRGRRRASEGRPVHEGIGHDREKYRIDNVALDTVDKVYQITTSYRSYEGFQREQGVAALRPTPGHLDTDYRKVNTTLAHKIFAEIGNLPPPFLDDDEFWASFMVLPNFAGARLAAAIG